MKCLDWFGTAAAAQTPSDQRKLRHETDKKRVHGLEGIEVVAFSVNSNN